MKNLKKPARLPRKAPSNQTGGTAWGKKLAAEISRMAQAADMKKLILLNFPYIIAFYMVEKAAWLYRHCNGDSVVDRLMVLFMNFGLAYKSVLPSFHPFDLMVGLVGAAALKAVIYFKGKNAKKYRQGEEYGSARWGNQKDIEPFIDPVFENNVILTQTERLMMSGRPKHPKYARNKNVIVIGQDIADLFGHLHQVGLDVKSGLTAAAAADHNDVLIAGVLRMLWSTTHHQPFGLRENDVVLEYRVNKRFDVLLVAPPGRANSSPCRYFFAFFPLK